MVAWLVCTYDVMVLICWQQSWAVAVAWLACTYEIVKLILCATEWRGCVYMIGFCRKFALLSLH